MRVAVGAVLLIVASVLFLGAVCAHKYAHVKPQSIVRMGSSK